MTLSSPLSISDNTIKLYNSALASLGLRAISDINENSKAAQVGNQLLGDIMEGLLSEYPWRFAVREIQLAAIPDAPPPPWQQLYRLPTSVLAVRAAWEGDQKIIFDVFERTLATMTPVDHAGKVSVTATTMVPPSAWPGYFREAATARIASRICMPLTQDERLAQLKVQEASVLLENAKLLDSQGRTPQRIDTKSFIAARRGRRR